MNIGLRYPELHEGVIRTASCNKSPSVPKALADRITPEHPPWSPKTSGRGIGPSPVPGSPSGPSG